MPLDGRRSGCHAPASQNWVALNIRFWMTSRVGLRPTSARNPSKPLCKGLVRSGDGPAGLVPGKKINETQKFWG